MKKFLYVTFLFLLFTVVYEVVDTYGLLQSGGAGEIPLEIGKWYITINDIDATVEREITASDLVYVGNTHIESGYFAPGGSASYDIVIDPKNTDVAIRYDITVDMSDIAGHPNITFDASSDVVTNIGGGGAVYSGVIPLSSIEEGDLTTITTSLIWTNNSNYDVIDNELNGVSETLSIKISIKFSQYLGEAL